MTSYTPGETGILQSSIKRDSSGKPVAVTDPVHAVERIDVNQSREHSDVVSVVKHETEHAAQINSDPLNYQIEAESKGQNGPLEEQAQSAGSDSSQGEQMTFGQALDHIMGAIGVTWQDLGGPDTISSSAAVPDKIEEK